MAEEKYTQDQKDTDASGLLRSIREDSRRAIDELNRKAESEITVLKETAAEDIENHRKRESEKTDIAIAAEKSMLRNRAGIDKRKIRMNIIEKFILSMIRESLESLREQHGTLYRDFLTGEVKEALRRINGEARVILSGLDREAGADMEKELKNRPGSGGPTIFSFDESNRAGGAVVMDVEKGIMYNSTVERVLYRMNDRLRREAAKIMSQEGLPGSQV